MEYMALVFLKFEVHLQWVAFLFRGPCYYISTCLGNQAYKWAVLYLWEYKDDSQMHRYMYFETSKDLLCTENWAVRIVADLFFLNAHQEKYYKNSKPKCPKFQCLWR